MFLEVAQATEHSALLRGATFFVWLLLDVSAAFPVPRCACGCSQALPLASAGPRDGFLPPSVLLEAAEAFVGLVAPWEFLGVNAIAS